jgi:hypothetical protein
LEIFWEESWEATRLRAAVASAISWDRSSVTVAAPKRPAPLKIYWPASRLLFGGGSPASEAMRMLGII